MKSNATNCSLILMSTSKNVQPDIQRHFARVLFGFMFFSILSTQVFGATKIFTGMGNFSDASHWTGMTIPVAGDDLRINGICRVDNNVLTDNIVYGYLTIGQAVLGALSWVAGGTNTLNVTDVNSSFIGVNALDMTNGGTLIINGTWTTTNLIFTAGTGTVVTNSGTLVLPTYNSLVINTGGTISTATNTVINGDLTISSGIFSVGGFDLTVTGTTTVNGTMNFTSTTGIKSFENLILNGTLNNTANEAFTITEDFQNNGTFNQGTGVVTFTGATSNTISGTAASTAFGGGITVNKGIGAANILEVQSVITMSSGGLILTNGTFKLSSASTITPFNADITASPYRIPATAGLWINGGTVSAPQNLTVAGLIQVSSGTLNIGNAADENLLSSWGTIIIDGGALNIAGRLMGRVAGEGSYFTMSAGTLTVASVSSTSSTINPFHLDNAGSSFTMSGGTIVIARSGSSNMGYLNTAGTSSVTGGTLQIGNTSTPASQTILINTTVPVGNLVINGTNAPTGKLSVNSLTVRTHVTITSGTLNANDLNFSLGGNWTRASAAGFTYGAGTVTFNGSGSQFIDGTATSQTFNNLVVSKVAGSTLSVTGSTTTLTVDKFTETSGNFTAPATMNINGSGSSVILTAGNFTAGAAINITGNWTNNGGTFIPNTNTLTFNGSGDQIINGTATAQTFYNLTMLLANNKSLSIAGSTTTLTVQDLTETNGDFTAGTAATVNINGNLTITSGNYTAGTLTNLTGNLTNNDDYKSAAGSTLTFTGISATAITGSGDFVIYNVAMNKSAKTTLVDIQTSKFISGINSGNVYNFTFTQGTWKHNNTGTLNDCHNSGVATALTIPFNVVMDVPLGTVNLCNAGTNGNVILSGKLSVSGGIVKAQYTQALNAGFDFRYKVNGGTPQLYVSNGGDFLVGAGFNGAALTDYIDFNMSGAASFIHLADRGYSLSSTFRLNNVVGGSTVMTDGIIAMESACNAAEPDIDMGGGNISPYSVTGGTVRFGWTGTQGGATWFGIKYYTATNYPNIDFQAGIAKVAQPYACDGQTFNVLSIHINSAMTLDMTVANPDPNVVFLSNNGTYALSIQGIILLGTGGVTFKGNGVDQLITGTATSYIFNNMTVNMTPGDLTYTGGSITALNVANYTQTQGDYTPPANFNVSGHWTHDSGTFNPGTNMVTFNGAGTQTINGTAATKTFYNVTIAKTAGTLLNTGGSTATITTNNLTQTTGHFTAPATLNINGDLLLSTGNFTAATTTNIQGNWTNNGGVFIPGTKTVNFIGTGTKSVGGSVAPSFYNLNINTVASTDKVQLTNNATVTSVLNLTKGVLDLNSLSLSITSGLPAAVARVGGYILSEKTNNSSKVRWNIGSNLTSHIYPFGTASGLYIPFTLNLTAGNIGTVTVSTYPTAYLNTPYPSTPILVTNMKNISGSDNSVNVVDRFWQIDKEGLTGTATLTFVATAAEVGVITGLTAQRYESSTNAWQLPIGGQTNTTTSATVPGVTKFSPWTLSGNGMMLPIELLNFTAALNESRVDLNWTTAAELNNDYFTVEKTHDLVNYKPVSIIDGAGNSTHSLTYSTPDINPYSGVSYYRLKQTDFNGTETYSNVVSVSIDFSHDDFIAYPNPVIGTTINVKLPNESISELQVIIYNMNGQEVFSKKIDANADGSFTINHNSSVKLSSGVYLLALISDTKSYQKKLIIE